MIIQKGFKYRIYPNQFQQGILAVQFGHSRFVYNHFLQVKQNLYKSTKESLSYYDTTALLVELKKEFEWLKQAGSQVLQQSLKNLNSGYTNFFKKIAGFPKFKSKYNKQSIRYPQGYKIENNKTYLPKVGWVKTKFHRLLEGTIKSVTVSKTKSGNYYASFLCELEILPSPNGFLPVGIDVGIKDFATLSTGEKISNPKYFKTSENKLAKLQRNLSKKKKGSINRNKARLNVAKIHEHISNQRKDFLHKLSHRLTKEYGLICLEDLNVKGMVKNRKLSKAISDVGWSMFKTFLKYKSVWYGSNIKEVDRFFPSSKTCSNCGNINKNLVLSDRSWTCSKCKTILDRDINASINILNECTAGTAGSQACGESVSPKFIYKLKQFSVKQEAPSF